MTQITFPTVIFVILNITFIVLLFVFVARADDSAGVYEQAYAKQIALFIDKAEAGTSVIFDISEAGKIADERNQLRKNIVKIDNEKKQVVVSLSSKGGYRFDFFVDKEVVSEVNGDNLILTVREANE